MNPLADSDVGRVGVACVAYDNLGDGWFMRCLCEFQTFSSRYLIDVADEMEEHWERAHGWTPRDGDDVVADES